MSHMPLQGQGQLMVLHGHGVCMISQPTWQEVNPGQLDLAS